MVESMAIRAIEVELGAAEPRVARIPAAGTAPHLRSAGGLGLALERHLDAQRSGGAEPAFAVAVGGAVHRGVPTAARVSLLARIPSTGRLADGQVGGELCFRLAGRLDLLVVRGSVRAGEGAVLVLDGGGDVRVETVRGLAGASPREARVLLRQRFGALAGLCVGPAGEAGAPLANVASLDEPASYVGRGGMGLAFGATGLKALVALGAPSRPARDARARALAAALERSPRLTARAEGGTLELAGDLAARGAPDRAGAEEARRLAEEARSGRHGCRGCPTPCGWILDGPDGAQRGARFGALAHLAAAGARAAGADPRELLARCDDLGLDAKGATFALARLGPLAPLAALEQIARGEARREQMQAVLDLAAPDQRPGALARLARRVAGPGRDPMRVGLALADADEARTARAIAPLPWPPVRPSGAGAEDTAGAGRLVHWHECLSAALDALGFCTFSAAGLLADGVLSLDELAAELLPDGEASDAGASATPGDGSSRPGGRSAPPGRAMIELGASLVRARHELAPEHARLAARPGDELEAPDLLVEYRACAGLDASGAPSEDEPGTALARAAERLRGGAMPPVPQDSEAPAELAPSDAQAPAQAVPPRAKAPAPDAPPRLPAFLASVPAPAPAARGGGRVELTAQGALGERLGGTLALDLALPASLGAVLAAAEGAREGCRGWLLRDGELLPLVLRGGARLAADSPVRPGDRLELVLVVAGG